MTRPLVVAIVLASTPAFAEGELAYRARVTFEGTATAANPTSPLTPRERDRWNGAGLFTAAADTTWDTGGRLRLAGGIRFTGTGERVDLLASEAYVRFSAASWLDLEAGKRLVRWGVGYGFSPTGVLDPPRIAADPNDRLGLNEGLALARADFYKADTSLTIAAAVPHVARSVSSATPERIAAARLRTVVGGGFEVALIGSTASGEGAAVGGNVTHVIGQQLEWHAEVLTHGVRESRVVSAVAGVQYTFRAGVNVVVEYHRNGAGLDDESWDAIVGGGREPGPMPARRQSLFFRGGLTGTDRAVSPEVIVIAGLDDGACTFVPSVTWTPQRRLHVYLRGTALTGPRRSTADLAPWSRTVTVGAAVRF